MKRLLVFLMMLVPAALGAQSATQTRPSFAGTWAYDDAATVKSVAGSPGVAATAIMGQEFAALQDTATLTLNITAGTLFVTAVYRLDGTESKNMSPGAAPGQPDIEVTSRCSWNGDKLVVVTKSLSPSPSGPVSVESTRTIWINAEGQLVIDRSGTPKTRVPSTRSVYIRVR
jgi:hypothetical protein